MKDFCMPNCEVKAKSLQTQSGTSPPEGSNHKGWRVNVMTRRLIMSDVTDTLHVQSGMHTHLRSSHLTFLGACVPRATDDVHVSHLRWDLWVIRRLTWLLQDAYWSRCAKEHTGKWPSGTNEWLQLVWLPKLFLLYVVTMRESWGIDLLPAQEFTLCWRCTGTLWLHTKRGQCDRL